MKKLITIAALALAFAAPNLFAQNVSTGGEFSGMKNTVKQYHLTANGTTVVIAQTARLYGVTVNVSNAGTAWTLSVTDKQGTAANFINAVALATTQNPATFAPPQPGINMTGGINLVLAGTAAGTADVWVSYR